MDGVERGLWTLPISGGIACQFVIAAIIARSGEAEEPPILIACSVVISR
jgi:hypothetical protein